MKCLVISTNQTKSPYPVLPMGAAMVAEALTQKGVRISFLDLCFSKKPVLEVSSALKNSFNFVCLSFRNIDNIDYLNPISYIPHLLKISKIIKDKGIPFVIGGTGASLAPQQIKDLTGAQSVFTGNAKSFANTVAKTGLPHGVTRGDLTLEDEDYSGFEKWIDYKKYFSYERMVPIRLKYGCRFSCSYCAYPSIEGSRINLYKNSNLDQFLRHWIDKGACIDIIDSVFNDPYDWALMMCRSLEKKSIVGNYQISALSPHNISIELLTAMEKIGVKTAMISADSASDSMLAGYNKPFRNDHLTKFSKMRKRFNFSFFWAFLIGGQGETMDTINETLRFIESLPQTDIAYLTYGIRVYPDTLMYKEVVNEGTTDLNSNILKPSFYFSKTLDPDKTLQYLMNWERQLNNVVLSTRLNGPFSHKGLKVMNWFKGRSPGWKNLSFSKKWLRRFHILDRATNL